MWRCIMTPIAGLNRRAHHQDDLKTHVMIVVSPDIVTPEKVGDDFGEIPRK